MSTSQNWLHTHTHTRGAGREVLSCNTALLHTARYQDTKSEFFLLKKYSLDFTPTTFEQPPQNSWRAACQFIIFLYLGHADYYLFSEGHPVLSQCCPHCVSESLLDISAHQERKHLPFDLSVFEILQEVDILNRYPSYTMTTAETSATTTLVMQEST